LHDDGLKLKVHAAVVMPDHVHMIFTPLVNGQAAEIYSLAEIMDAIKGASAHKINRVLGRTGRVWQTESFDHVLRSSESLDHKIQYLLGNPVRRGLVATWQEYRWLWYRPSPSPFNPAPDVQST
jgi:REP element-mobilizing transposase RayT